MKYLVKKAQKKDDQAFVELMERCKSGMYKVARSYLKDDADIADAIQETVINCYEHIGRLKNADYFKTWLTRILINNCKDILAAGKRVYPLEQIEEQENTCMEMQNYEFQELMNSLMKNTGSCFFCITERDLRSKRSHKYWRWMRIR